MARATPRPVPTHVPPSSLHQWLGGQLAGVARDARLALRTLRRNRGFTAVALLILALCLGANTGVFSLLYTLVLRPLPLPDAHRLIEITNVYPKAGIGRFDGNVAQYLDYRKYAEGFAGFAVFRHSGTAFPDHGAVRTGFARATADFFSVAGVAPLRGVFFGPEQCTPGEDRVVVISQSFWESYYHADPDVIGRTLQIGDDTYSIVAVAPRALEAMDPEVGIIKPLPWRDEWIDESTRHSRGFALRGQLFARLSPGTTLAEAHTRLAQVDRRVYLAASSAYRDYVDNSGYDVRLATVQDMRLGPLKRTLYLLQAAALLVLLTGGVNVANLLLARANVRQRELALRCALGAGRGHLARQLGVEAALLASGGCLGGIILAAAGLPVVNRFVLPLLPDAAPMTLNRTLLGSAGLLALAVGGVVALLPVVQVWRLNLNDVIRRGSIHASGSRAARSAGSLLVSLQVAMSMVLLAATGLLLHSFARAVAVTPGMDVRRVVTVRTGVSGARFQDWNDIDRLQDRILDGMRRIPGVESVALATHTPTLEPYPVASLFLRGRENAPASQPTVRQAGVSPDYFATLGIPVRQGRTFDATDDRPEARRVIIDQRLADIYFPRQDPLGRQIGLGRIPPDEAGWWSIVGVAGTASLEALDEQNPLPVVYLPVRQFRYIGHSFFARSTGAPGAVMARMREAIVAVDSQLPPLQSSTLANLLYHPLDRRRTIASLLGAFAALASTLAAVGIYGVMAYDVSQRTREIGIRGAVGATRRQILWQFLRQAGGKTVLGIAVGVAIAMAVNRLMTTLLFDVSPYDGASLLGSAIIMLGVGLGAGVVPAWRAARVEPVKALRAD